MAEILLCNQPTRSNLLDNQYGISTDSITGLGCVNPDTLNSYTPYLMDQGKSAMDRDIMRLLSPAPVAKELTNLSLSFGADNTLALAEITAKLQGYNIGLMGASTSVYANRIGGFAGAVKDYQNALMQYRDAVKNNPAVKSVAKKKSIAAFEKMQRGFRHELNAVTAAVNSKKGTPLTSATRGTNIAMSSRNVAKHDVTSHIQANNLVKFSQHAKLLGNGLAVIDFGSRVGNIHNGYKEGGEWERDLFVESTSFVGSVVAGSLAVNAGLSLLIFATPFGWVGLIVGGVVIAGVAASTSIGTNYAIKQNSGDWYDEIMGWVGGQ